MTSHLWTTQEIHIGSKCLCLFREILHNTWTVCSRILLHMSRSIAFQCSCDWNIKSIVLHLKQKASWHKQYFGDFYLFPLFKRAATLKGKKVLSILIAAFVELNIAQVVYICRVPLTSASNWIVCWFWKQMHWFR